MRALARSNGEAVGFAWASVLHLPDERNRLGCSMNCPHEPVLKEGKGDREGKRERKAAEFGIVP